MNVQYTVRPLRPDDGPLLWPMLYHAIHVPEGQEPPSPEIVRVPELARYVEGWGRAGDSGFLISDAATGRPLGAVWVRLLQGENKGYGYVADDVPELSIAIVPDARGQGAGSQLLRQLMASDAGSRPLSLSVSPDNPAVRLYERFGFRVVAENPDSLVMKRG